MENKVYKIVLYSQDITEMKFKIFNWFVLDLKEKSFGT